MWTKQSKRWELRRYRKEIEIVSEKLSEAFLGHNKMLCVQILGEIKQTWSMMSLSYERHTSTGTPLLKADENLIETLEDNQVTPCISQLGLAEISSNKFGINIHSICSGQFGSVLFRSD